jgi:hypothetical protein
MFGNVERATTAAAASISMRESVTQHVLISTKVLEFILDENNAFLMQFMKFGN